MKEEKLDLYDKIVFDMLNREDLVTQVKMSEIIKQIGLDETEVYNSIQLYCQDE